MTHSREVLVAHQPAYLPWPGFFSRLLDLDQLVLLDHVQYVEGGWQNRNFVADRRATPIRVTVPIYQGFGQRIDEVRIAGTSWARRHWRTLTQCYGRAPYWPVWQERLHAIYHQPWQRLVDLNEALIRLLLEGFGLQVSLVRSSALELSGTRTQMLVELCQQTGTHVLRAGTGAAGYLDAEDLAAASVQVEIATYTPPTTARTGTHQIRHLSALDLLLHHGDAAIDLLRAGACTRPWKPTEVVHS